MRSIFLYYYTKNETCYWKLAELLETCYIMAKNFAELSARVM